MATLKHFLKFREFKNERTLLPPTRYKNNENSVYDL